MSSEANELERLTIVIVTYFSAACIEPLAKVLNQFPNIVFVDNGSSDATQQLVSALIPRAQFIGLLSNIGFGAANNRGFAACKTEFALMANPDVMFDLNAVRQLLQTADQCPDAAFIAPQLIGKNGKPDGSYRWPRNRWKSAGDLAQGPICTGFVTGAFILARKTCLDRLHGFDENFFLYYEDEDICQRAFNAGMSILIDPRAVVTHFSRGSVKTQSVLKGEFFRAKHHTRSKFLFERKHNPNHLRQGAWAMLAKLWLQAIVALPLRLIIPSPKYTAYLGRVLGRLAGLAHITLVNLNFQSKL